MLGLLLDMTNGFDALFQARQSFWEVSSLCYNLATLEGTNTRPNH